MFRYYGRKARIADIYPEPRYDTIIEPFCGSAAYSLWGNRWKKRVILYDVYEPIVTIWQWLIHEATPDDIRSLPELRQGEDLRDMNLPPPIRYLLGFWVNHGVARPRNVVTKWAARGGIGLVQKVILANLYKVKHWEIHRGSYETIPNQKATWFIDPPYQYGGDKYPQNKIDYPALADWCRSRRGEILVCEGAADWLPFKFIWLGLSQSKTGNFESLYYKDNENEQTKAKDVDLHRRSDQQGR